MAADVAATQPAAIEKPDEESKENGRHKSYDELNKPLMFAKNQEEVARKITDFRESIIERFGSSQVPTPAVKDVYKQCGGGAQSSTVSPHVDAMNDDEGEV